MASVPFKNIMIAGGSGNVGGPLIAALLTSNDRFNVSVIIRNSSTATFPPQVTVKKVNDYDTHPALVEAIKGQDVLICTLNDYATAVQIPLINAAIEAGVRRFIPSEFASNQWTPPVPELKDIFDSKVAVRELLVSKARETAANGQEFHWTAINNGLFFDWCFKVGFFDVFPPPKKSATIWDTGSNAFSVTNLSTVAKAIVSILSDNKTEAHTRDRFVTIESFATSQNEIVSALEKVTGSKWDIEETTTESQFATAQEEWEKGEFEAAYFRWVRGSLFSGQEGCLVDPKILENDRFGLPQESLQETVDKIISGQEA